MTAMRAHSSTCVVRSGRSCGRMRPYEATGCPSMVQHHVFHIRSELYRRIGCCSGVDVDKKTIGVPLSSVARQQSSRNAVIIVDHGSRRKQSNDMLLDFVDMYKRVTQLPVVEAAHMELAKPSIDDAFNACVQQGATQITVAPYFFFPGKHIREDIPALVQEAAQKHPGVQWAIADPIGIDERMAHVIHSRVQDSWEASGFSSEEEG